MVLRLLLCKENKIHNHVATRDDENLDERGLLSSSLPPCRRCNRSLQQEIRPSRISVSCIHLISWKGIKTYISTRTNSLSLCQVVMMSGGPPTASATVKTLAQCSNPTSVFATLIQAHSQSWSSLFGGDPRPVLQPCFSLRHTYPGLLAGASFHSLQLNNQVRG